MRTQNWEQIVTTDSSLVFNKKESDDLNKTFYRGPYVTVKGSDLGGFALIKNMVFGDISGDGQEEAAIILDSGGTGGAFVVVLFGIVSGKPKMIEKIEGYKMSAKIEKGELIIPQPVYAGWEGNCCPSGSSETRYILSNVRLTRVGYKDQPYDQAKVPTVAQFYALLNQKKYDSAYQFLSPSYQLGQPYDKWKEGYAATNFSGRPPDITDSTGGKVKAQIVAFEKTDAGEIRSTYDVVWSLVWSSKAKQWLLDSANVDITASRPSNNSAIRTTNWFQVLINDPNLKYDRSVDGKSLGIPGPYLNAGGAYGHAMLENISYGDISGDAREEAVIPLHSGGTAGVTGMLLYTTSPDGKPKFAQALGGYKMSASIQAGQLRITMPIYAGWEPNCCPTGFNVTRYALNSATGKLQIQGSQSGPLEDTHTQAVEQYYNYLSNKKYKEAYDLLSASFQSTQSFAKYQAGYANTKFLDYKVTKVDASRARAEIIAQEGNLPANKYFIYWSLVWSEKGGWKLNKADVL
jgi:hypothetical protein